jgi:hypothetical protein
MSREHVFLPETKPETLRFIAKRGVAGATGCW